MRLRSSNPVLRGIDSRATYSDHAVTYANVAMKTIFLVAITGIVALYISNNLEFVNFGWLIGAFVIGFISVIVGTRSVKLSPIFSVIYAVSEGVVLGVVSSMFAYLYEGIVPTALMTTLIVLVVMMLLYSTGIIKVTQKFASFMVVALISVIFMSLISLILPTAITGQFYYLVAGLSALLSAFFLFLDFESIRTCVDSGTDAKYGWILSLGLMVTLVWIYVEILRLLAIFGSRRN
ncbi:MAG: Bax inhibitor-1/YccA family protein [Firmicutes bacterium]|nr:Bax inhibitor-1/YccA family protein [Bacillota bacterium]